MAGQICVKYQQHFSLCFLFVGGGFGKGWYNREGISLDKARSSFLFFSFPKLLSKLICETKNLEYFCCANVSVL